MTSGQLQEIQQQSQMVNSVWLQLLKELVSCVGVRELGYQTKVDHGNGQCNASS